MSQLNFTPPVTRSWRDIPQQVKPRTMGRVGKRRLVMSIGNIVALVLVVSASAWGIYELLNLWETNPQRITAPTKGIPLRDIALRTDGVLDKIWVQRTLELSKTASLMELDLGVLKSRLEESGQVSKAVIERRFPDILKVTLQERSPVARIMARVGEASPTVFLVSRDGTVYSGVGYNAELGDGLPFIDGVKLVREGSGFSRLEGMDVVADLLGTAQASAPAIYKSFKVVSLARFSIDRTLMVKSTEVDAITFGASQDSFYRQLARLDYILTESQRQNSDGKLKSVNLSIGDKQVPVCFETPKSSTRETVRSSGLSLFGSASPAGISSLFAPSAPSRNSSPSKRDF
jgi:POTRA domain, FtsQ-type